VLPGDDHLFYVGHSDAVVDEIEEFLTGARSGAEGDVRTMTGLFTDIVASTEHQTPGRTTGMVTAHRPPRRHGPSCAQPPSGAAR
jgi:hypothetical protein